MNPLIVLSHFQMEPLLQAHKRGEPTASTSPNLRLTTVDVQLTPEGVIFPGGEQLDWGSIEKIKQSENKCFLLRDNKLEEIRVFSKHTNWLRSLMPTESAPTTLVAGVNMHRIKRMDPHRDTLLKIKAASPVTGRVLDTATGLGYTAIEAARTASHVVTIELDPAALVIARLNPWSQALFDNPRIEQIIGDSFEVVQTFRDGEFSLVIHDPPVFSLGGELYSGEFYRQLYRVLNARGRLFHYIGDLDSKSGRVVSRGAMRRLNEAGFKRVVRRPEAFGVMAYK